LCQRFALFARVYVAYQAIELGQGPTAEVTMQSDRKDNYSVVRMTENSHESGL